MSGNRHVPPWLESRARRITNAARRRPMTTAELEREISRAEPGSSDPAEQGLKVRAAVERPARRGLLTRTAPGWTTATAGVDRLNQPLRSGAAR